MKTAEDVIAYMAKIRKEPYPEDLPQDALLDVLKTVLDCLVEGKAERAISGLASLIDVIEHLPKRH